MKQVIDGSVAADSGLRDGDIILSAAGFETRSNSALIEIIQRQAPGTLLPLTLKRGDQELELLARFPKVFE